ncbi:MAG: hypothetical protein PQJ59_16040 [Spirochaetales bacterium]|nr:hypothetical protein [Spirochaetales bacterium]
MNYEKLNLTMDIVTAEKLYSFLYRREEKLEQELVYLLDYMEKDIFSSYSIEKMKELTFEKKA